MLDMPILKFEKSKIYLNSQLQVQQNNKQLILDIIANIGSILNDASTDKKENFESILESSNVFLQTITSNITMIEQLDIEIKNITKELNTLLSDKSRTKEYYIAAFTNLKQTIIIYSKKFSEIEKKLSFDNTNFNNFITVNNFKYNFESVENDNTYKFTGFTINDNEINVTSNDNNIDSIKVEDEPTEQASTFEENTSNTDDIIISEDDLLEEILLDSENDLEESLFETNNIEEDIVITENDLIEELLNDVSDINVPEETSTEETVQIENDLPSPSASDDLIISEDDLIDELLNTSSNEDTFLDLDLTNEIVLDFENNDLVNSEKDINKTSNVDSLENNELSEDDLLEELLSNESLDTELLDLNIEENDNGDSEEFENTNLEKTTSNISEQIDEINNLDELLLEDLSINDILDFDDEKDDENYSNILESLDFYINTPADEILEVKNNVENTTENELSIDLNFDDIIEFSSPNFENEATIIDNTKTNEEDIFENTNIEETTDEAISEDSNQNEIFEVEDPFEEDTIPVYSESTKIDELTSEFKTLLLDLSNNGISSDSTATALISMLNQAIGNTQNSIEITNVSPSIESDVITSYEEIDFENTFEETPEDYIEYLNNLSVTHTDIQNVFTNQLLQNMNLFEVDICDDIPPPINDSSLSKTDIITNEVQTTLEISPTQYITDNELLENSILENIVTNDVTYTNEENTSFDIDTESKKVDYYNIDKEVIESIMNELSTDKNFIGESENKDNKLKSFSSYSDLYNNIYMTSKKAEKTAEISCNNTQTSQEQNNVTQTTPELDNNSEPQNNEASVAVTPDNSSNAITEVNIQNEIPQELATSENIETNNNTTLENTTEEIPLEISIPAIDINTSEPSNNNENNINTSTDDVLTQEIKETFPSISLETTPINEGNTVEDNSINVETSNVKASEISTDNPITAIDEIDIESEVEASLVDELILSTNDIEESVVTVESESVNPPVTVQKETCSEKIEKIEKALEDNETLLISERTKKIYLPYKLFELQNYISSYPDAYTSLEDVVSKEFILPLDYFSAHPKKSRFSESYNLLRNREGKKMFKAFSYALGISQKTSLNPAIIASCKSKQELDHYIICMESNSLENFQNFNIVYEVNPAKK